MKPLSKADTEFVFRIFKGEKPIDAYVAIFPEKTNKPASAIWAASRNLYRSERVQAALEKLKTENFESMVMDAKDVFAEWAAIATADPNDIVSVRRVCCRYCYGRGHRYQFRDEDEVAERIAMAIKLKDPMPDTSGGIGFRANASPHPDCPRCMGEGSAELFAADTRKLTGKARKLYAGAEIGKYGLKVTMRDQDAALANIARALGMLAEKITFTDTSKPSNIKAVTDIDEAADVYGQMIKRNART